MTANTNGPARAHDRAVSLHPGALNRYLEVVKDLAGASEVRSWEIAYSACSGDF